MGDSIWKKEISFGKKPKEAPEPVADEVAPVEPAQSFLKKEISFSRKPKAPKEPKAPKAESTSLLKKEISFGKKSKEPKAPKAESTSIWKKDLSLGKGKSQQDELARLMANAAQAVDPSYEAAPVPATPPTALAEAVVAAMPPAEPVVEEPVVLAAAPEPAPVPVAPVADEPVVLEPVVAPVEPVAARVDPVEPILAAVEPVAAPVEPVAYQPEPVAAPVEPVVAPVEPVAYQPEPVAPVEPVVAPVEPVAYQPEPVAAPVEPVAYQPEPVAAPVEPVAYQPEPVAPVVAPVDPIAYQPEPVAAPVEPEPQPVEPWLAGPELPPAPETAAVPVVVHPPVPAAELPPLPEPKVPFWKKELGGKKKTAAADAPTDVLPAAPNAPSAPFWKRQLNVSMPTISRSGGGRHAAKKLVGLKIGASQLAAACVSNNGSVQLERVVREPLLPGVVVGGELRDPDALGDALKSFFERNKLQKKNVRLGLASNRIGVRIVDIVGVAEDKQLANAVQFRAQEALPIPLDEAVLDYRVLGESTDDEGQPVKRVLLVVAHRELVERYLDACKRAGVQLMGIDLEAFAMLRALSAPADRGSSALVAVSVGHDRSTFAVSDGRTCEFTRVLEWGGWMLNVALARVFESTPSEVEALKRQLSLDGSVQAEGLTPEQLAVAIDALRKQVQVFARELVSSLQFYQNQPNSLGIGEIVLTGGSAHLPGMAEELQRLIGVPVRVGDPLARVVVAKKVGSPEQVGSLAVAIGLGIED